MLTLMVDIGTPSPSCDYLGNLKLESRLSLWEATNLRVQSLYLPLTAASQVGRTEGREAHATVCRAAPLKDLSIDVLPSIALI